MSRRDRGYPHRSGKSRIFTSAVPTIDDYQQFLVAYHNVLCSMSSVSHCADNAAAEGVFGMLKRERVNWRRYATIAAS